METDLDRGVHIDPNLGRALFGEFAQHWLEQRNVRPRTRETYASQLTHILEGFEDHELRQITPAGVRDWHGRLLQSGLHRNTVAKVYRLFRTMMDTAADDALIAMNPVHIKGAAAEQSIERPILEWDQVRRVAELIEPRFCALVWTAATSGLRFGELTAFAPASTRFGGPVSGACLVRGRRLLLVGVRHGSRRGCRPGAMRERPGYGRRRLEGAQPMGSTLPERPATSR
ncbi:MAG: tyrosine recombinase XerC, partial [Acidimicrobiales bacterium]